MVRLSRIYTRTGDDGTTGLGDGSRSPKYHLRVAAYGTVDELSSTIGVVLATCDPGDLAPLLRRIQNELFDVGADLCVPGRPDEPEEADGSGAALRIQPAYTKRLEDEIDAHNERLQPLKSFILPGGEPLAAWLHQTRTVCRRAERIVSELASLNEERDQVNPEVLRYLNRLSDLFFVLGPLGERRRQARRPLASRRIPVRVTFA